MLPVDRLVEFDMQENLTHLIRGTRHPRSSMTRISKHRGFQYELAHSDKFYHSVGSGILVREKTKLAFTSFKDSLVLYSEAGGTKKVKLCEKYEFDIVEDSLQIREISSVTIKRVRFNEKKYSIIFEKGRLQSYANAIHTRARAVCDYVSETPTLFQVIFRHVLVNGEEELNHGMIEMEQKYYPDGSLQTCFLNLAEKLKFQKISSSAIKMLHTNRFVHMDWKFHNILVDRKNDKSLLIDFELAESIFAQDFQFTEDYYYWPRVRLKTTLMDIYAGTIAIGFQLFPIVFHKLFRQNSYTIFVNGLPGQLMQFSKQLPGEPINPHQFLQEAYNSYQNSSTPVDLRWALTLTYYNWIAKLFLDVENLEQALDTLIIGGNNPLSLCEYLKSCNEESRNRTILELQSKHHTIDDFIEFQNILLKLFDQMGS